MFYVSPKNLEPLLARFRSLRDPIFGHNDNGYINFYQFDGCSNCLTIRAKAEWNITVAEARKSLEKLAGFALLPRERTISNREFALLRAKELFGPEAFVKFEPSEKIGSKWRYRIYASKQSSLGGHGSDWDNALKVAVLAKSGWFYDNEVEPSS